MAVSIDTVYQKVLALANKEQRGYITPQEFNLFADMAQKEIFEQYFYDINQWTRQHGNDHGYSDMLVNLEEKIGLFEHVAVGDNVVVLNKYGDISIENDLPNLYRMGAVSVKYPEHKQYVIAEPVSAKDFRLTFSSALTKYTKKRPVYLRYASGSSDKIKIYPYPVEDDGSDFDLSTNEYTTTPVVVTSIIHSLAYHEQTGRYFRFAQDEMNALLGYEFEASTTLTLDVYRAGTLLYDDIELVIWNDSSSNSLAVNDAHGRIADWNSGTSTDFQVGDTLDIKNIVLQTNKRNVKVDYTKKPLTPNWAFVVVNQKAFYSSHGSQNFELHASEETELIYKILKFAGISLQKQDITQAGQGLESAQVQKEKQ